MSDGLGAKVRSLRNDEVGVLSRERQREHDRRVEEKIVREVLSISPELRALAERAEREHFKWGLARSMLYARFRVPQETRLKIETAIVGSVGLPGWLEARVINSNLRNGRAADGAGSRTGRDVPSLTVRKIARRDVDLNVDN